MSPEDAKAVEREVLDAERAWMDAIVRRDVEACARILGEEYTLTAVGLGQAGRIPRERWLEMLPQYKIDATRMEEGRVLAYDGFALFQGRMWQRAIAAGRDRSGAFLVTDAWVRRDGRWRVVARHTTLVPEAG